MVESKFSIAPQDLTEHHVSHLSLHDITQNFGTLGLYKRLNFSLTANGLAEVPEVVWATQFGFTAHANDTRTNGHYADHILRVTLRILDHYHITDPEIVAAAMLHDSLEDHAVDIVAILAKESIEDEREARDKATELMQQHVGEGVMSIVEAVTNLIVVPGENKLEVYKHHTRDLVTNSPKARVVKLSDFTDNAVGNHYTVGEKQQYLDQKYLELYQIHRAGLFMPDSIITGEERHYALRQLTEGHARALARLSISGGLAEF